jgi:transposase
VFNNIFAALAAKGGKPDQLMIDATHLKAHRTAASLPKKGGCTPTYRMHQRRTELETARGLRWSWPAPDHAAERRADERYKGAALMIDAFPKAKTLLGDRATTRDWFRAALADRGIAAGIPSKANRKAPIPHDTILYRRRHEIENMFGRLKDWRRIHTRCDRCARTFLSANSLAAVVIF